MELEPGESCEIFPGYTFEVNDDGQGCVLSDTIPGGSICDDAEIAGPTYRGFEARRIEDTSRWRIDAMPPAVPSLPLAGLAVLALLLWRAGSRRLGR